METKNPLESTTIIAAIVGLLSYYILNFTDIVVSEEELMQLAQHVFVLGSLAYTIYGRWKASGPIQLFKSEEDDVVTVNFSNLTEAERAVITKITEKGK